MSDFGGVRKGSSTEVKRCPNLKAGSFAREALHYRLTVYLGGRPISAGNNLLKPSPLGGIIDQVVDQIAGATQIRTRKGDLPDLRNRIDI
jgi:hypothetical protein